MNKVYVILALAVCLSHWLRSVRRSVTGPSGFAIVVAFSIGLLAVVAAGTWHINTAFASPVDYCSPGAYTGAIVARDGQRLSDQTADVRELFANAWGEDAAARWVFEHNCTLGSGYEPQTPSLSMSARTQSTLVRWRRGTDLHLSISLLTRRTFS